MDGQRQLRWAVALATLVVCAAVPAKREVYYASAGLPQQQQYNPAFYNLQSFQQPQQYQGYQPLQVRSVVPQYYQQQQLQQLQQQQLQQQQQPFQFQPQPQYQRVIVYNPSAYQQQQMQQQQLQQQPLYPGGAFLPLPLRAEEGGSTGGSGSGGWGSGWGGFNPAEYLTVLQNYWQTLTGPGTQSGKPPAEQAGASPSPSGAESPAEAPESPASPEGSKKPEAPAAPQAPAAPEAPASVQRFFVVSQPQVVANPLSIPSPSNGGVSTYLLLRNQPLYGLGGQGNGLRVQPIQPEQQPLQQHLQQPLQHQQQQQAVLPSVTGPMVLVRTADNKYGLAPAGNPTRVLVSGEGIRAQDDVQVQGPGSQALAYQRFLLTRQGQYAPGFYPAPHPGVVHSLTDESISVDALRDAANATEQPTSTTPTTTPASNKDDEEVVDSDVEKPVSIAQAKPQAIALAGPGGVAAAAPMGTALVGPGGMALAAPSATAVAGPTGGNPGIAVPAVNTAAHNADAFRKWLSKKKPGVSAANDDVPVVPEFLVEYGSSTA